MEGIFIFTKDRPTTLLKTLESIKSNSTRKFLIDSSTSLQNQQSVKEVSNSITNCTYLGNKEFKEFTSRNKIEFPKYSFLLREFGNPEWNLGYARNFALLYSKALGLNKVLFSDDDIEVPNQQLIGELFQAIDRYPFAGANITGLVDDSILGHIATDMGIVNEKMLSGGFLAFNPDTIDHYFLNNYNEDWIWLFLQLLGKEYWQIGEVIQELSNPFENYSDKILFQEFGEIAIEGVLNLLNEVPNEKLGQVLFWKKLIQDREEYLNQLIAKAAVLGKHDYIEIIQYVKSNSAFLNAEMFSKLFNEYYSNREEFLKLYSPL